MSLSIIDAAPKTSPLSSNSRGNSSGACFLAASGGSRLVSYGTGSRRLPVP